jgi:hypothetical protein
LARTFYTTAPALDDARGVELTGSVEAMIGVKIKVEANIDVADIFLIEASAEAFAGAMAKAEVEIKATIDGVAFKLEAEAFAGAKIKGKAGLKLRMCGYDIIKGEAEGYLFAGIGPVSSWRWRLLPSVEPSWASRPV